MLSRSARVWLWLCVLAQAALLFALAHARYANVHHRTFDLALYARAAWGFARLDASTPVLDFAPLGIHLSPALWLLGLLGRLSSTVHVLLLAQALCAAACVFPLARIGARHMGRPGILLGAAAWLLYPNLFHVATFEFHPGTLAVLPMCWAFDALERGQLRHLSLACAAMLCCREDLFVMGMLFALLYVLQFARRQGLWLMLGCALYGVPATALVCLHAPENSSLAQHFGVWGGSPFGILRELFSQPALVFEHLRAPERAYYLPRLLAVLSFFPLRAARLLVPALPYLALNLASEFPTATMQYSHYLTPAVPALVVAGLVGVTSVRKRPILALWLFTLALGHYALGGSPFSRDFDRKAFRPSDATQAGRAVLAHIPPAASVQAPDALLPHLAERAELHRAPPPVHAVSYLVLDVSHRQRYARRESLLRTTEEPLVRELLARPDHALLVYAPPYALLKRGGQARQGPALSKYFHAGAAPEQGTRLTACLSVLEASLRGEVLTVLLRAHGPCRADLALRIAASAQPARADLLFDGALSPALLRAGDVLRSEHVLRPKLRSAARSGRLWFGTVRADGKTVEAGDPLAVPLPVQQHSEP